MGILKKDKKGFLLGEETLKIIIAVICIVFLVYLLVAVYRSSSGDKKIAQAAEVLFGENGIDETVTLLRDGESERKDIIDPSGWHIYTFTGQEKPNSCLSQKCLCICQKTLVEQFKSQEKVCDEKGKCLVIPRLAAADIDLKIRGADDILFIEIINQNGRIFIRETT